jgi:hypothetical protein
MIEFKGLRESVRWAYPRDEILLVLKRIAEFAARAGVVVTVTSMNDHKHADRSLHHEDLALDCQILKKDGSVSKSDMDRLVHYLKAELPGGHDQYGCYDIVWRQRGHENHAHIEWDCRQRKT